MREIKFRALVKHALEEKPSWEYYSTLSMPWWLDNTLKGVEIIIKDFQFTGLKDKNGKEIYEGDIVERDGYASKLRSEIRWVKSGFEMKGLYDGAPEYTLSLVGIDTMEIIGNIYENPEILVSGGQK